MRTFITRLVATVAIALTLPLVATPAIAAAAPTPSSPAVSINGGFEWTTLHPESPMDLITSTSPLPLRREPPAATDLTTIARALRAIPTVEHVRLRVDGSPGSRSLHRLQPHRKADATRAAVHRELAAFQPDPIA